MAVDIVEVCSVQPQQGAAAEQSLKLLYFDMIWFQFRPTETLRFYDFKCSQSDFFETIVVKLKHSLSIALKKFIPLAGKIVFPLRSDGFPATRYAAGDSIDLTIAVSDVDFADVTGNHSKPADEFHCFVPQQLPAVYSSDEIKFSAVAIQLTLFPNKGICIGFTHHHAVCDATSLFAFVNAWASIHRLNGDEQLIGNLLPFYGRSSVQNANKLAATGWSQFKTLRPIVSLDVPSPINKVRATFVLSDAEIERLRSFAIRRKPAIDRPSAFVVVSAHLWSCLARSAAAAGEEVADCEPEYFTSPIDCRARLNPPLPQTYFGNCLILLRANSTHGRLRGTDGFVSAVEAIAAAVGAKVEISHFFENRKQIFSEMTGKRVLRIAGSSRMDPCSADYGWGRATKYEGVHTDFDGAVNIFKARDGGVDIGLSMPKVNMDAFADVFNKKILINSNL